MAFCFTVVRRTMSSVANRNNAFNHVTIVGGGLMGSGIAQVTAQAGMDVTIIEVNEDAIKKSNANIQDSIQKVAKRLFQNRSTDAEKYISESMGRLKISLDLKEAVSKTDLVIEAIVENIDAKHHLFSRIDAIAPEHTIFASNTSSLSISEIAAVTQRKDRFAGLHFFNPVPMMKLLEVIRTNHTSDDTFQKLLTWGRSIGKTTICCKDTPGFVVNRLLVPYLAEAARMLEREDATAKDIDSAMKLGAGYPMGPLELLDYVGLDTTKFILDGWHKKDPNNPLFAPIDLLDRLVAEGKLGKKTGEGFYTYKKSTGNATFNINTPFFHPLAFSESIPSLSQSQQEFQKEAMSEKVKRIRNRKAYKEGDIRQSARMEEQMKLKKLEKFKSLEKWKNSDDFIKSNKDRDREIFKKPLAPMHLKSFEESSKRPNMSLTERKKNLKEFIMYYTLGRGVSEEYMVSRPRKKLRSPFLFRGEQATDS